MRVGFVYNQNNMSKIELGDTAKDTVTGCKGTVVAITDWIHGCKRYSIQAPMKKDGTIKDPYAFDEDGIELVKKKKKPTVKKRTGGPVPSVHKSLT